MQLHSAGIPANSQIDLKYAEQGIGGQNTTPDLTWSDAPAGTKSFAITVFDPDAPTGSGWWHWVAVDLPVTVTSLAEGAALPESAREWVNDYGYVGYGGPYPPPGPAHHYVFTVYALPSERLDVPDEATSAQVRFTLLAAAIDSASFTAIFANPQG
ncbi:YbhB/YbcL family Raf kinase inhibitor-like protein [Aestuariimicrobium sp. Y1814]|uniref:YbhB/YbcL family Raf kinase inhibitor-like protein n=1 Tax=Aestuariimicrobium sp. Y1814 TaxID=3418742 RepID=UPI003DA74C10